MKQLTLIITLAVMLITSAHAGWWGSGNEDKERIQQVEQQMKEEQHKTGSWQVAAGALAVCCVLVFSIGAAMGSRARKEARRHESID